MMGVFFSNCFRIRLVGRVLAEKMVGGPERVAGL
jgi:hypothetical protein